MQNRGEFLYAACGEYGMRVFDIAFIDDKAFSERVTTAPVSPIGQKFYVPSRYCTAVAAPTTIAPDPTRIQHPENFEQPINGIYAHLYMLDRYEGLILVGAGTLLDGNPLNNFLSRELTWNPGGILNGGRAITIVGHYAYICCDAGLVVVSLEDPLHPLRHQCHRRRSAALPESGPSAIPLRFRLRLRRSESARRDESWQARAGLALESARGKQYLFGTDIRLRRRWQIRA